MLNVIPKTIDRAADPMPIGGPRVDLDRLVGVGKAVLVVARLPIGLCPQRVSKGAIGVDLDPAAEIGDGVAVVTPELKGGCAKPVAVKAAPGLDVGRLAEIGV